MTGSWRLPHIQTLVHDQPGAGTDRPACLNIIMQGKRHFHVALALHCIPVIELLHVPGTRTDLSPLGTELRSLLTLCDLARVGGINGDLNQHLHLRRNHWPWEPGRKSRFPSRLFEVWLQMGFSTHDSESRRSSPGLMYNGLCRAGCRREAPVLQCILRLLTISADLGLTVTTYKPVGHTSAFATHCV